MIISVVALGLLASAWTGLAFLPPTPVSSSAASAVDQNTAWAGRRSLVVANSGLILPGDEGFETIKAKAAEGNKDIVEDVETDQESKLKSKVMGLQLPGKARPDFGLCATTGRPTEFVYGSELPRDDAEASRWMVSLGKQGVARCLALVNGEAEAAQVRARLEGAGMAGGDLTTLDLATPGARDAAMAALAACKETERARLCVCASPEAPGAERGTALVLGSHVMQEYECAADEAFEMLKARVKHSGVGGRVPPSVADLEAFAARGQVDLAQAAQEDGDVDEFEEYKRLAAIEAAAEDPKLRAQKSGLIL